MVWVALRAPVQHSAVSCGYRHCPVVLFTRSIPCSRFGLLHATVTCRCTRTLRHLCYAGWLVPLTAFGWLGGAAGRDAYMRGGACRALVFNTRAGPGRCHYCALTDAEEEQLAAARMVCACYARRPHCVEDVTPGATPRKTCGCGCGDERRNCMARLCMVGAVQRSTSCVLLPASGPRD